MTTTVPSPSAESERLAATRRRLAVIAVDGLGPLGLRAAEYLVGHGFGTVALSDSTEVGAGDLTYGYRTGQQGRPRAEAAGIMLSHRARQTLLIGHTQPNPPQVDLCLVTGSAADPARLHRALAAGICVLPAAVGEAGFSVGPLLTAEAGICPDCLHSWGLLGAPGAETAAASSCLPALAAAVAAQQVQLLIDGVTPAAAAAAALLGEAETGALSTRAVTPHPECACFTRT